jgi:hypothetical protein
MTREKEIHGRYFYPRDFCMIRDGDFADHGTFQKATRETFEKYGFLKRVVILIG